MAGTIPITFAESAVQDLEDILAYYADQAKPQVGSRLVAEIIADVELLSSQPRMGRMVPEFEQDFLLELIRPPFRIVYRADRDQVRVVRVWRSERLLKLSQGD
ncbi:MAG: type II toxin-antitoxin system RelE/ParE family toxin [Desulfurivibrio sp.]|nr:type II toxin-antitoxin system RelE/ParE family toxin [Desulfurivibrio sp.]MBU3954485.1 type II toxin-antitoxin system RelE/ParE family toxin [Pseudomonadota bacterium]MBU4034706.1 type II toxin-antitoxin system RelE/ParE family toxin [Pseudomonadota bacterium]MBU4118103.1 type II toxin-antitoxin system RelE/ParE family toxin [Pseudomonadota bacterium]